MAQKLAKGIFITFEGCEGSGKSTHSERLCGDLLADGHDAVHTSEPGGTSLGIALRGILLQKENLELAKTAELLLFEADRAQHVDEIIRPNLELGKIVICDRFNTATFAYQGYGLGADMKLIKSVDDAATGGICPDLTILLDVDIETGLTRIQKERSPDKMEKRAKEFHEKVRRGYLDLAKKSNGKIKVIESGNDIDKIYSLVKKEVYDFIT